MSSLSGADKQCLEVVFGMEGGYVLDFSNARFEQFFDSYDVDIRDARYQIYGESKAKRMRAFWDQDPDELVGRVLFDLLDYCDVLFSPEVLKRHSVGLQRGRAIAARLSGISLKEIAGARDLPSLALKEISAGRQLRPPHRHRPGDPTNRGGLSVGRGIGMTEVINLDQKWYIGDLLEKGGFGRVHLAKSESGEPAVIKLIPQDPGAERELQFEDLGGVPNIVPILDRGVWHDYWVLVMARADKSLRARMSENDDPLSVSGAVQVLSDVAQALVAIEERIVHRDIKPENILLLGGRWCLADFGISRYAEATTGPNTRKYSMTPPYAAPEQWRRERATSATDVYALGVVAYELLAGELPFVGPDEHDYMRQHLQDPPGSISGVPNSLQSLIHECLYKAPESRPKPHKLLARLNDSVRVTSEAVNRLQQANALAVQEQVEVDRQESLAQTEFDRRFGLREVATRSLEIVVALLNEKILSNASAVEPAGPGPHWSWSLREARLRVAAPSRWLADAPPDDTYALPFEVIVHSNITVQITPHRDGYGGRSHSLWYCDAQEKGKFRWYETAFMKSPAVPREEGRIAPFALEPGRQACIALSPGIAHDQVAWPFTPIDQGDEGGFLDRWIGWFANGAQGLLCRPNDMPERGY